VVGLVVERVVKDCEDGLVVVLLAAVWMACVIVVVKHGLERAVPLQESWCFRVAMELCGSTVRKLHRDACTSGTTLRRALGFLIIRACPRRTRLTSLTKSLDCTEKSLALPSSSSQSELESRSTPNPSTPDDAIEALRPCDSGLWPSLASV